MMDDQEIILQCINVEKTFHDGDEELNVLHKLSLTIHAGEKIAIIGASGSGKSTLLQILGGLDKPSEGQVLIGKEDITKLTENKLAIMRNKKIGFIYQFHHLLPEFSVLENVCMPLLIRGVNFKLAAMEAYNLIEHVNLSNRLNHKPSQLSGGERQRASVARALVTKPLCVLADEPTGNLDPRTADLVYELIVKLNIEFKTTFLVVTHDHELAAKMDRTYVMRDRHLLVE